MAAPGIALNLGRINPKNMPVKRIIRGSATCGAFLIKLFCMIFSTTVAFFSTPGILANSGDAFSS